MPFVATLIPGSDLEQLDLDGLALNSANLGLASLSCPPPRQRQDWIGAADSEAQLLFRDPLHENRKVTATINVTPAADMDGALQRIGEIQDKLKKASQYVDGIPLTWQPAGSSLAVTFDVLSGEITDLPIDWESGWMSKAPTVTVEMTAKPYWRGTETLTGTTSSSTPFVVAEIVNNSGDIPALGRLIVTDTATQSRRHVEWGLEGPLTYNAATSLLVDSDDMVTSGFSGAQTTSTGAYDPNAAGNNVVALTLVAGTTTAICGTGNLSHVGVFRVKARVKAGSLTNEFRLSWKALDGPMNHNGWISPISGTDWTEMDLGTITVPAATAGTQRWTGQIEVMAAAASPGTAAVDYLVLTPASAGYGKARGVYSYSVGVLAGQDPFTGSAALNGRTAALGGTWATSGDATGFAFSSSPFGESTAADRYTRGTTTDTAGHFAILGATGYTDTQVDLTAFLASAPSLGFIAQAAVARWTDANNHLRATVEIASGYTATLRLRQLVAGVATDAPTVAFTVPSMTVGATGGVGVIKLRLIVFASGRAIVQVFNSSGTLLAQTELSTSALATGGTLASGKPGFWDFNSAGSSRVRAYDDFSAAIPPAEPVVIYSGRNMQIRYDDTIRQDSTGTYTGRPQSYLGSRFLVPVGTSRVLVKARRNDVDAAADDNVTDATQIQIGVTARGLVVPRA